MTNTEDPGLPRLAAIGRGPVLLIISIALLCWVFVLSGSGTGMSVWAMSRFDFPPVSSMTMAKHHWTPLYAFQMMTMWWMMMLAMMLVPLAYQFHQLASLTKVSSTSLFLVGYGLTWLAFAIAATTFQWILEGAELIHPHMMWSTSCTLSFALLVAAGVFQATSFKTAKRGACRLGKISFRTGLSYGEACLINSTPLMLLFLVGGIMNMVWMVGLTGFVMIERTIKPSQLFDRSTSVAMIALGIWCLFAG